MNKELEVTSSMTFIAQYVLRKYNIYYTTDHGTLPDGILTKYDRFTNYVFPILTEPGYEFNGWKNVDGIAIERISYGTTGDIHLTA